MPQIKCKTHNSEEVITHVGVDGEDILPVLNVWDRIKSDEEFYTFVDKKAKVYARTKENGTKYLTSHSDGYTPNNLDELKDC